MISTQHRDGIAVLIIDMPGRSMNVFTPGLAAALRESFEAAIADAAVKGIVIASGKSSFIAGADLAQMSEFSYRRGVAPAQALAMATVYGDLFRRIETAGKPVVAAAGGTALGAGLELMLACHHRLAAESEGARFGLPEAKLGLLPGAGGTQRVPRLIGLAASIPLLTQGAALSAAEAQRCGLLHELAPSESLIDTAIAALLEGRVKAIAPWDEKGYKLPGGDAYSPSNSAALVAANARAHVQSGGNFPAPLAILRCLYEGTRLPFDKALRLEQKLFVTLVQGDVAQNLIRTMFFAKQAADKLVRRPAAVPPSRVRRLGILGCGLMGAGIAQNSALAGIEVVMLDRDLALAQKGRDGIAKALETEVAKGRLSADRKNAALARIFAEAEYSAFGECDLVIEAVLEDSKVKAAVTRAAEACMKTGAIYATNTSALPVDELAQASVRPGHFIGLHFFSPVPKMALVEVVVGSQTSDETLARSLDYIRQIGKTPIIVRDGYGFYTTRCVDAYLREGIRLLADGVDPRLIEHAGVALGMPIGPLALGDEVGLDVVHHIAHFFRSRENGAWADDRHETVDAILDAQIAKGRYGRKTQVGFYRYPSGGAKQLDHALLSAFPRAAPQPEAVEVRERLLYAQLVEAARCWAEGVSTDAGELDLGATLGWAFPAHLGGPMSAIDQFGAKNVVDRLDRMSVTLGERFTVPDKLREHASGGLAFHAN